MFQYEIELINGLRPLVVQELRQLGSGRWQLLEGGTAEAILCQGVGDWRPLLGLRLATAVYAVHTFPIPRPKGLLGHQYFHQLLEAIGQVRAAHPKGAFRTLRLSAAGADSAVFQRLKAELATHTQLTIPEEEGDLFLRVRRGAEGWQVLVRLTPRPLATRPWRVANMPGALNGPLCAAMITLTHPQAPDCYLNIACGSGSLLAERAAVGQTAVLAGCDISGEALTAAQANTGGAAVLAQADAGHLPYPSASFNVLVCDLPWGQLVGSHTTNTQLYPALLAEAQRVARPEARFALITHEVRLLEQALAQQTGWGIIQRLKIRYGNIQPVIFVLKKGTDD